MAFASLSHFIRLLEDKDELIIVEEFVDPVLEISEITDRFSKTDGGGKALLFMNNGTDFPVLTNSMGSLKRLALAHGVSSIADISNRLEDLFNDFREPRSNLFEKIALLPKLAAVSGFFPSLQKGRSPAQEEIILDPDLNILPVLKTWPHDGGRFFTLPMVITTDPETGERNVGMYRMQVFDRQTTGMHWHRHKTGADHYEKYKKAGRKMPVAVALGGDPVFTYSATAPLPPNVDEFLFAGLLREKKVSLTKAVTQDILVPAEADIILEGYVDPEEDKVLEGPFGDHTGFYSLEDYYPKFHITAITHRKNAIYPATLVGIPPQEDAWIAKATERIFMMPIRKAIAPELTDMNIPDFGVAHNLALVKIKKTYPGQARKVMNALWGAGQMMFNKILIIANDDVDLSDPMFYLNALSELDPESDFLYSSGPLDVLDHASDNMGYGGKLGIDLTPRFPEEKALNFSQPPDRNELNFSNPHAEIIDSSFYKNSKGEKVLLILYIRKMEGYNRENLIRKLIFAEEYKVASTYIIVDEGLMGGSVKDVLWYLLSNLETGRDLVIKHLPAEKKIFFDGTSKRVKEDNFPREWPNVVTMSKDVIKKIDKNWEAYGLGEFISSPSNIYYNLKVTPGARVRK